MDSGDSRADLSWFREDADNPSEGVMVAMRDVRKLNTWSSAVGQLLRCCAVAFLLTAGTGAVRTATDQVLTVHDAIGPASADYIVRGLQQAQQQGAALVVLGLDTPVGLEDHRGDQTHRSQRVYGEGHRPPGRYRARTPRQSDPAEGEKQAAVSLLEAAQMLSRQPRAMQLRYLQTIPRWRVTAR